MAAAIDNGGVIACSPNNVLVTGLSLIVCTKVFLCGLVGISSFSSDEEYFEGIFGSAPEVYAQMWLDLLTTKIKEARVNPEEEGWWLEHLLLSCAFAKCYKTLRVFEKIFGTTPTAISEAAWPMLKKIKALKAKKCDWPDGLDLITVRPLYCRMRGHKSNANYSWFENESAVCYETAISLRDNKFVWINGPFPARTSLLTIHCSGLRAKLTEMETVGIAYNQYQGAPPGLSTGRADDTIRVQPNLTLTRQLVMERHKIFNQNLLMFKCLSEEFRHGEKKHQICFEAVVVIVQYQLNCGKVPFPITPIA